MPLFNKKQGASAQRKEDEPERRRTEPEAKVQRVKLQFRCQQAQGSPTGIISDFSNIKELYQQIANCYDFPPEEILFCTLNTHKADMSKLLGGQIGLEDFIFVHRKGRPKEIEITKTEDALGLTITDNGAGYAFIKRIREGSLIHTIKCIEVGDHIEKIDDVNLIGRRHFEVAKMLKDIPKGTVFTMRLVEPLKAGFCLFDLMQKQDRLQFHCGLAFWEILEINKTRDKPDDIMQAGIDKINNLLESFMGINDSELATVIWEKAEGKANSMDFAEAIDSSDLEELGFSDDFIIELWGAITDARAGRLF
ncbi:hypothetical protein J437_LFUL003984 [Ladona fulva]|uniref:PDZ domain-containing protein n=1 Tax=Ladona fulva TaxID=123851 RepID=A0A8K0NZK2_LADFU|nr:hypothetical protein J437_LFUL003984 [Ladona fulva]